MLLAIIKTTLANTFVIVAMLQFFIFFVLSHAAKSREASEHTLRKEELY